MCSKEGRRGAESFLGVLSALNVYSPRGSEAGLGEGGGCLLASASVCEWR